MNAKTYLVYASLLNDIDKNYVWVGQQSNVSIRTFVCITNLENSKRIYVDALSLDNGYVNEYQSNPKRVQSLEMHKNDAIVLNQWHRNQLGIESTQTNAKLSIDEISRYTLWLRMAQSGLKHPDTLVRQNTQLALLSLALGLIGILPNQVSKCFRLPIEFLLTLYHRYLP